MILSATESAHSIQLYIYIYMANENARDIRHCEKRFGCMWCRHTTHTSIYKLYVCRVEHNIVVKSIILCAADVAGQAPALNAL